MKKRIPALLLAVMLLLALPVSVFAAWDNSYPTFKLNAEQVNGKIVLRVILEENAALCSLDFALSYPSEMLSVSLEEQERISNETGFGSRTYPEITFDEGEILFAAARSANADFSAGSEMLVVNFDLKGADTGKVEFTLDALRAGTASQGNHTYSETERPSAVIGEEQTDRPAENDPDKPDPTNPDKPEPDKPDKPEPTEPDKPEPVVTEKPTFPDIQDHWGAEYIGKAAERGLFTGFEDGTFRPDGTVTRGQFVTVLWRMAGKPAPTEPCPFEDVAADAWYADGVAWAHEKGYVNGRTETSFDPDGSISRQEAMKILFAYNGGASGEELMFYKIYDNDFADSGEIADWAKPAMYWGYYNKIINGKTAATLCPKDTATRAELAKILVVYSEQ